MSHSKPIVCAALAIAGLSVALPARAQTLSWGTPYPGSFPASEYLDISACEDGNLYLLESRGQAWKYTTMSGWVTVGPANNEAMQIACISGPSGEAVYILNPKYYVYVLNSNNWNTEVDYPYDARTVAGGVYDSSSAYSPFFALNNTGSVWLTSIEPTSNGITWPATEFLFSEVSAPSSYVGGDVANGIPDISQVAGGKALLGAMPEGSASNGSLLLLSVPVPPPVPSGMWSTVMPSSTATTFDGPIRSVAVTTNSSSGVNTVYALAGTQLLIGTITL